MVCGWDTHTPSKETNFILFHSILDRSIKKPGGGGIKKTPFPYSSTPSSKIKDVVRERAKNRTPSIKSKPLSLFSFVQAQTACLRNVLLVSVSVCVQRKEETRKGGRHRYTAGTLKKKRRKKGKERRDLEREGEGERGLIDICMYETTGSEMAMHTSMHAFSKGGTYHAYKSQ